jgi:endo-1,4-beta-xylanase
MSFRYTCGTSAKVSGRSGDLLLDKFVPRIILSAVVFVGLGMLCLANEKHQLHTAAMLDHDVLAATPSSTFRRPQSLPELHSKSESLRSSAAKVGLYFGSMQDSTNNYWRVPWVQDLAGSEFNLMEPGNQFKWWIIHPARNAFNFAPADALVDYAIAHNMKVRGHTLLWGMANPEWLGNQPARSYKRFSNQQLEEILIDHIRTVIGHYRDKYPGVVRWWDVTNEVMGWNNKFNSDGIEWTNIGTNPDRGDYLRVAFRTARSTDPAAILCMNDWGNEGSIPDRTQNMIDTVKAFRAEGVPIDCVGMEGHLDLETAPTYGQILQTMKAYADMGVQVQITEFDIKARPSAADWNKAAIVASNALKACVDSPNCTAFNNWGFTQAIYQNGLDGKSLVMLPWDEKGRTTPVYSAMRDALNGPAK